MKFEASFHEGEGYLRATGRGDFDLATIRQKMQRVREEAERTGHTRILIDTREMTRIKSDMDRYLLGVDIARILCSPLKVAILVMPSQITGFTEDTAVNRGAHIRILSDYDAALQWLLDTDS